VSAEAAETWARYDAMEARLAAPLSTRMLDLAGVGPGTRVLDLATGRGEPAIPAAHRGARVVGVDVAADMLAMCRERARREGVTLELHTMDAAAVDQLPGPFDAVLCRWGLMFMGRPVDALAAARRVARPGAPLVVAVWQDPVYLTLPRRVLAAHRDLPPLAEDSTVAFADQERLEAALVAGGWQPELVESMDVTIMEATTDQALVDWVRVFGARRLADGLSPEVQRAWERDLVAAAQAHRHDGVYRLGGITRIVVGR
jgi:SAM-dependent methyltransferase